MKVKGEADYECYREKWFWDKSIETKDRKDTFRYRVIDQATDTTILPENEWYDPADDDNKIKILFVGLPFKDHRKCIPELLIQSDSKEDTLIPNAKSFCSCGASAPMSTWIPSRAQTSGGNISCLPSEQATTRSGGVPLMAGLFSPTAERVAKPSAQLPQPRLVPRSRPSGIPPGKSRYRERLVSLTNDLWHLHGRFTDGK